MSSFKADLILMRNEWYNAFYNANIEQLDYLETEWFIASNGQKVLYKKHQLRKIALAREEGIKEEVRRREFDVVVREFREIACVSGTAELKNGHMVMHVSFIENWIKINGGWKLQFIAYESL
ncbi:TPA: nuclear transport factor 2 family protein [Raoultella ornithinolytica]